MRYKEILLALRSIKDELILLDGKLNKIMVTQAELDAATQALTVLTGDVATNVAQLQTDVANLKTLLQQPALDATALDAAVTAAANTAANLDAAVQSVTAIS
jgi:hypothetical protein